MDRETMQEYLDAGWDRSSLQRIDEIVKLINKLPIQTKEQQEALFTFMIEESLTYDEREKYTSSAQSIEDEQEEEKALYEAEQELAQVTQDLADELEEKEGGLTDRELTDMIKSINI